MKTIIILLCAIIFSCNNKQTKSPCSDSAYLSFGTKEDSLNFIKLQKGIIDTIYLDSPIIIKNCGMVKLPNGFYKRKGDPTLTVVSNINIQQ